MMPVATKSLLTGSEDGRQVTEVSSTLLLPNNLNALNSLLENRIDIKKALKMISGLLQGSIDSSKYSTPADLAEHGFVFV